MILKVLLILAIVIMFAGCTQNREAMSHEKEEETVRFRITWKTYSGRGETIQGIVDLYNNKTDGMKIEVLDGDEDLDSIRAGLHNKTIDVCVLPYRYTKLLGHEGLLHPLNIEDYVDHGVVNESLQRFGQIDGSTYGVPWVSHSMALIYNSDLLTLLDINPDDIVDKESFLMVLDRFNNEALYKGIGLVGKAHNDLSWMVNQAIHGSGGQLIAGEDIRINSSETVEGLSYYKTLGTYAQDTWLEDTGSEVMTLFRQEKIAFEIQSIWGVTDIWKNGSPFEVGIIPLERIGFSSEVGPMMLNYGKEVGEEKKEVIDDFIAFMLSSQAQEAIMKGEFSPEKGEYYPFRLPVREDVFALESFKKYEVFKVFVESYDNASIDVPNPYWMMIKDEVYTSKLHDLMMDKISIDQFIKTIELEGQKIIGGVE